MNGHCGLTVLEGCKVLRHRRRNGGIARNHLFNQAAHGFQPQRKRRDVKKQPVVTLGRVARKLVGLHRSTDRHDLVGINVTERFAAEVIANGLAHARHAGRTAHEHHALDVVGGKLSVRKHVFDGVNRLLHQMCRHGVEFGARKHFIKLAAIGKFHRHTSFLHIGERFASGLDGNRQTLFVRGRENVGMQSRPQLLNGPANQAMVEIVATKRRIATRSKHFKDTLGKVQKRNVKRTATEVVDQILAFGSVVQTICQCCSRRFVEKTEYVEACQLCGVLRRLALCIIKIGRDRDHGADELRTDTMFGSFAQDLQNFRGDLHRALDTLASLNAHHAGRVFEVIRNDHIARHILHATPHQTLDRADGVQGI